MRIKNYKDLVGLSIAQARAAYDTTITKYGVLVQTIANVATQRDAALAEVDRLTKVIASYDTPEELRTARDFIKTFNIDVEKTQTEREVQLGREIMDEDAPTFEALAKSEAEDRKAQVTPQNAPAGEKPSTDSLQKVWKAINGTRRGRAAEISKWTRRRLAQLNRLEELGHAFKAPSGSWWARDPGPQETDR